MSQVKKKGKPRSPKQQKQKGPAYRSKPQGVGFFVYDLQGSPLPDKLINQLETTLTAMVKASGIGSLATDFRKE